ncbi:MAG: dihydroneopterin aldolase [Bacteroidetes bacterium]|nr:dihydroneopterin aldolase [Bacteroidota bacterium]
MITVFLDNQHVKAQIGWLEDERKGRVDLWISIHATLKTKRVHDDLARTLDYGSLVGIVFTESAKERKLLETLAEDIIAEVDDAYPNILDSIEVVIKKKKIPVPGFSADAAGIKIFRKF